MEKSIELKMNRFHMHFLKDCLIRTVERETFAICTLCEIVDLYRTFLKVFKSKVPKEKIIFDMELSRDQIILLGRILEHTFNRSELSIEDVSEFTKVYEFINKIKEETRLPLLKNKDMSELQWKPYVLQ